MLCVSAQHNEPEVRHPYLLPGHLRWRIARTQTLGGTENTTGEGRVQKHELVADSPGASQITAAMTPRKHKKLSYRYESCTVIAIKITLIIVRIYLDQLRTRS